MKKTLEFGRYLMNKNELQEIEWIVLNEDSEGKKLLISKKCIEAMQYEYPSNKNHNPNWNNCFLRSWLNNDFLNNWFTVREKEKMLPIPVYPPLGYGKPLEDKIILLNAEEVKRYLPNEKNRRAKPTIRAKRNQNGLRLYTEKGYCTWLLRDPSDWFGGNWTGIDPEGKFDLSGGDFYLSGPQGIRPVIMIIDK